MDVSLDVKKKRRKRRRMDRGKTSSCYLPEDLVIQILLRLPIKSLMRFRCVCKFWYTLTRNHDFISDHFCFTKKQSTGSLIRSKNNITRKLVLSCLDDETPVAFPSLTPEVDGMDWEGVAKILGPVNGIFCVFDETNIVLWNPATRESKVLPPLIPPPNIKLPILSVGFGLDSETNHPKVLRSVSDYEDYERDLFFVDLHKKVYKPSSSDSKMNEPKVLKDVMADDVYEKDLFVDIYTLTAGSWSDPFPVDLPARILGHLNIYVNGASHWWAQIKDEQKLAILSFHMTDEVFQIIPIPSHAYKFQVEVAVVNECLGLICSPIVAHEKCFDIWVMKEYGVKESWAKLFTVGPILQVQRLLGILKNGDYLFEKELGQLVSHKKNTPEIKSLNIDGPHYHSQHFTYKESIFSLSGGNELQDRRANSCYRVPNPLQVYHVRRR